MDAVFQYEIPLLHPLAVHFPLALLLVGAAVVATWAVRGTDFWHRCGLLLFAAGFAGALFAYFTGETLKEQSEGTPIVDELVALHEDAALWTLILSGATLLALVGVLFWSRRDRLPTWARWLLAALALAAAGAVAWTGHIGGTMVWGVPA